MEDFFHCKPPGRESLHRDGMHDEEYPGFLKTDLAVIDFHGAVKQPFSTRES